MGEFYKQFQYDFDRDVFVSPQGQQISRKVARDLNLQIIQGNTLQAFTDIEMQRGAMINQMNLISEKHYNQAFAGSQGPPMSNLEWLDKRVDEMRVKL